MIGTVILLIFLLTLLGAIVGGVTEIGLQYRAATKDNKNADIHYDWVKVGIITGYGAASGFVLSLIISLIYVMVSCKK